MNKQRFIIIGAIAATVLVVLSFWFRTDAHTGTLELTVVPKDATVLIDGKTKAKPGTLKLAEGRHKLDISRDGFTPDTLSVDITAEQQTSHGVALKVSSDVGRQYLDNNPEELAQGEGIAGQATEEKGEKITQDNPLVEHLPYTGSDFSIYPDVSLAHPKDPLAVSIRIVAPTPAARTHALNWIKARGFDPAAYEIIYDIEDTGGE